MRVTEPQIDMVFLIFFALAGSAIGGWQAALGLILGMALYNLWRNWRRRKSGGKT